MKHATRFFVRSVAAVLVSCVGSAALAQVELTNNGGFETGDTSGWTSFDAGSSTFGVSSADPFEGNWNGVITNNDIPSGQVVKQANLGAGIVTPGQEVTIRFRARGTFANGGVAFAELFSELAGGGTSSSEILTGGPIFVSTETEWQDFVFVRNLGPNVDGGVTLQFNAATGGVVGSVSELEIDAVSLQIVPEPASLGLAALAGLGLIGRRRR